MIGSPYEIDQTHFRGAPENPPQHTYSVVRNSLFVLVGGIGGATLGACHVIKWVRSTGDSKNAIVGSDMPRSRVSDELQGFCLLNFKATCKNLR